jgi:hypothetical protein
MENINEILEEEWLKAFPILSRYKKGKYYKIVGPLIVGLEMVRLNYIECYRPHFVAYGLWENSLNSCLKVPEILFEIKGSNGRTLNIPYSKQPETIMNNLDIIRVQLLSIYPSTIKTQSLFDLIEWYLKNSELNAAPFSVFAAQLHRTMLRLAIFAERKDIEARTLDLIRCKPWDQKHFTLAGMKVADWIASMEAESENPSFLLAKIRKNRNSSSLSQLPRSELIG